MTLLFANFCSSVVSFRTNQLRKILAQKTMQKKKTKRCVLVCFGCRPSLKFRQNDGDIGDDDDDADADEDRSKKVCWM